MTLEEVLENLANSFIRPLPSLLGAILIVLFGWLLGKVVAELLGKGFKKIKMDKYFKIEKGPKVSELFALVIKWLIYLVFMSAAVDVLQIPTLTRYFQDLIGLITGLLGGSIVILVSYLIARYLQKQIRKSKSEYSGITSQLIFLFIMIISLSMAFLNILIWIS
jgi:phosphotransferase system  glucose/maltose/N-acetylglucosamine-specific IIC component